MKRVIMILMVLFVAAGMAMAVDMDVLYRVSDIARSGIAVDIYPIDELSIGLQVGRGGVEADIVENSLPVSLGVNVLYHYNFTDNFNAYTGIVVGYYSGVVQAEHPLSGEAGDAGLRAGGVPSLNVGVGLGAQYIFNFGLVLGAGIEYGYAFSEDLPEDWTYVQHFESGGMGLRYPVLFAGYRFSF